MKLSIAAIAIVLSFAFISCNQDNNPTASSPGNLSKKPVPHTGLITTQVLIHTGAGDVIIPDAVVQLFKPNGKSLIANFEFQPSWDPYPGYYRCPDEDTSGNYVVKCTVPSQYAGRAVFSCLTAQFGVGTINSDSYTIRSSDWSWTPAWGQGEAYPRQFYIAN